MNVQNQLYLFIGIFVLTSAVLAFYHSIYWLAFTVFIGLNLIQFSFTGFCPLEKILQKLHKWYLR